MGHVTSPYAPSFPSGLWHTIQAPYTQILYVYPRAHDFHGWAVVEQQHTRYTLGGRAKFQIREILFFPVCSQRAVLVGSPLTTLKPPPLPLEKLSKTFSVIFILLIIGQKNA